MYISNVWCISLSLFASITASAAQNLFGQNFIGDGTYYNDQGDQGTGNCAFGVSGAAHLPWTAGLTGPRFVALDAPLYNLGPGSNCGLCIAFYGSPLNRGCTTCGTTPIPETVQYAMVSNSCPECRTGDLDQASNGDGRFKINWHAVQCQVGASNFVYAFANSNPYYISVKVSNTRVPVAAVSIRTQGQSSFAAMQSTNDNSWLLFSGVPLTFPADVLVTSVLGDVVNDTIPTSNIQGPPVEGQSQFPHHAELECVGGSPNTTVGPTCGDFCSSPYKEVPQPVAPGAATESALTLSNIITLANTSCTQSVPAFDQCGGNEGGCVDCVDAPWPGSCCTSGYSCDRKVSAFWGCTEIPLQTLSNSIQPYEQCGGLLGDCANSTAATKITGLPMCTDGPWGGYECTSNFTCARYGSGYWRCDTVPARFPTISGAQTQSATPQTVGVAATCAAL